jgi:hypothetical protein
MTLPRRVVLGLPALFFPAACKSPPRCASCGMVVDPTSRWFAEIEIQGKTQGFDTPKCALRYRLSKAPQGQVWVRSYYKQQRVPATAVLFLVGSDVLGPMGADLVPVEPELEPKFRTEHRAQQAYPLDKLTLPLVESI